MRKTDTTV